MPTNPKVFTNRDFNPGGARWCDEHNRLECTKNRTKGRGQCHQLAIRGMSGCRMHSGFSGRVAKAQGEARITAFSATGQTTINASAAVLSVLQMSYLRLGMYSELLRRQVVQDGESTGYFGDGGVLDTAEISGLIGHRYGMGGKDGVVYVQTEEVRALVVLEAAERDRVVKYAKTAHDMGISERITSMAESWGDIVAGRISTLLDALGLTEEQQEKVPALLQQHLSSIEVTGMAAITDGKDS